MLWAKQHQEKGLCDACIAATQVNNFGDLNATSNSISDRCSPTCSHLEHPHINDLSKSKPYGKVSAIFFLHVPMHLEIITIAISEKLLQLT